MKGTQKKDSLPNALKEDFFKILSRTQMKKRKLELIIN